MVEGMLGVQKSKRAEGVRSIALSPALIDVLAEQFQSSPYRTDDVYVFAHPKRGVKRETSKWYPEQFRKAVEKAGITDYVRPHHDNRHASLTNMAAAGANPVVLMTALPD